MYVSMTVPHIALVGDYETVTLKNKDLCSTMNTILHDFFDMILRVVLIDVCCTCETWKYFCK